MSNVINFPEVLLADQPLRPPSIPSLMKFFEFFPIIYFSFLVPFFSFTDSRYSLLLLLLLPKPYEIPITIPKM